METVRRRFLRPGQPCEKKLREVDDLFENATYKLTATWVFAQVAVSRYSDF